MSHKCLFDGGECNECGDCEHTDPHYADAICPTCNGTGDHWDALCDNCGGSGRLD